MANIHVLKENMSFVMADKFTRILHTHQMGVSRHKLDTLYDAIGQTIMYLKQKYEYVQ